MMKNKLLSYFGAILLIALLGGSFSTECQAGYCSDHLYQTLADAAADEYVSVLIFMSRQLDVKNVDANYKLATWSRQAAHKLVIDELQYLAESDQYDLLEVLAQGVISGAVESFESYWIANAVRVNATRAMILSLQERADIEVIIENRPPQSLYYPRLDADESLTATDGGNGVSVGLKVIGADSMWARDLTGKGRLIGSLDTGVDGDHPALRNSYRGNNGYSSAESWFDPVFKEEYPHYDASVDPYTHGTNTMGVMVGKSDSTGDTTGVAWGAQWISAMVVDVKGANYLEAFQWMADPDGDPNTTDDVPDVLSNSWGFRQDNLGCLDIFWTAIDNLEALGTVVLFACGNEGGDGAYSLRNPANRATTIYNTFSVGAVNPHDAGYAIWPGSSRGPSDCDSVSIKPEVTAPGYEIYTTHVNGSYTLSTGTSFAAPHVAGAVALLRQHNPNASVDTIKAALMKSAVDLGDPGEDNTYGMGLINIPAALALMPPNNEVSIYLYSVDHGSISLGETLEVVVTLKNSGVGALDVWGHIVNADPQITVIEDSAWFGDLAMGETADNAATPYKLQFSSEIPNGALLDINLEITAAGGAYFKIVKVYFRVGEALVKSSFTHVTDSCRFTISNYGVYGLAANSIKDEGGVGFVHPDYGNNNLFQCGLLIGTDSNHVSDAIVNLIGCVDDDFAVAVEGNLREESPGYLGDIETVCRFIDSGAPRPLGITVEQRTASCEQPECANYVILEYAITNSSDTTIAGLYVGLYLDWDFPYGTQYAGSYDNTGFVRELNLGYMYNSYGIDYRGTALLSANSVTTYYAIPNNPVIWYGVTEADKYDFLTAGTVDTAGTGNYDQSYCIATGPFLLEPGATDTAAFAILGAHNLERLKTVAATAKENYRQATPIYEVDTDQLPTHYRLDQNFPNPFNPETQISYMIPRPGRVTIKVYNILGAEVAILLDQYQPAGTHLVSWDGTDSYGSGVASGIYFYRMTTADFQGIKKMLLLK